MAGAPRTRSARMASQTSSVFVSERYLSSPGSSVWSIMTSTEPSSESRTVLIFNGSICILLLSAFYVGKVCPARISTARAP